MARDVAMDGEAALRARLRAALASRGAGYAPRTRHLLPDGSPRYTNRLLLEGSPYLQQHAHNPVDWYPWGDEAFARARRLGRPVFLSVGYSTCHWCHVMEEESFEDEDVARYLNEHYVCIKVDREERPDLDAVYMAFVQTLTGRGGWPMSLWLTSSRQPFYGGTYFPPRAGARGARVGFLELSQRLAERYAREPSAVTREAEGFARQLRAEAEPEPPGDLPGEPSLALARAEAARRFDPDAGGARGAPKFPSSFPVRLLLRIARRNNDPEARRMAVFTLEHMRNGGMYDHIGGGFHRYAVDDHWRVPHFEKMLYDNALLAVAYLEAGQETGERSHLDTARAVLDYLLREMRSPGGCFFAATDADSPDGHGRREEGLFFTWTPSELEAVLGAEDARVAGAWFGVTATGDLDGRTVLRTERGPSAVAAALGVTPEALQARVGPLTARLLTARAARPPPLRDDKVIVAWNALAVTALARASLVLREPRYGDVARQCAMALAAPLRDGRGLPHAWVGGAPSGRAFADDRALLALALLDVFEVTGEARWLDDATGLLEALEEGYRDPSHGGYHLTDTHHERLLVRERPDRDGPTPSANSAAALAWLRLGAFTDDPRHRERAEATLRGFSRTLGRWPLALDQLLLAVDLATSVTREVVLVVPEGSGLFAPGAGPLLEAYARAFVPNASLVVGTEAALDGELGRRVPWVRARRLRAGQPTAYVCERGSCQLPTSDPAVFAAQLRAR
ncbi:MAG: thioredoxin domain-containing protein [Deltaproteobacteria bacterium]|nr:thioredoxin domain-containing protein [Deltaproteobacteria bacterium]